MNRGRMKRADCTKRGAIGPSVLLGKKLYPEVVDRVELHYRGSGRSGGSSFLSPPRLLASGLFLRASLGLLARGFFLRASLGLLARGLLSSFLRSHSLVAPSLMAPWIHDDSPLGRCKGGGEPT